MLTNPRSDGSSSDSNDSLLDMAEFLARSAHKAAMKSSRAQELKQTEIRGSPVVTDILRRMRDDSVRKRVLGPCDRPDGTIGATPYPCDARYLRTPRTDVTVLRKRDFAASVGMMKKKQLLLLERRCVSLSGEEDMQRR